VDEWRVSGWVPTYGNENMDGSNSREMGGSWCFFSHL